VDASASSPFVVSHEAASTVVTLAGDFDIVTTREVAGEVNSLLTSAPSALVLDLSQVEFIDSSGIALLLRIHTAVVGDRGGTVRVVNPSAAARRTFELCGLTEMFGFETT
jgi:anti-sigma B factor antagonist